MPNTRNKSVTTFSGQARVVSRTKRLSPIADAPDIAASDSRSIVCSYASRDDLSRRITASLKLPSLIVSRTAVRRSSGSASAAVAHKLDLCDSQLVVHMPGGNIDITISDDYSVLMTGPVTKICDGIIDTDMFYHS